MHAKLSVSGCLNLNKIKPKKNLENKGKNGRKKGRKEGRNGKIWKWHALVEKREKSEIELKDNIGNVDILILKNEKWKKSNLIFRLMYVRNTQKKTISVELGIGRREYKVLSA